MPDDRKIEQSEIVLNNSSSLEDLTKAVDRTYTALLQKYSKSIETA
jgi:dephospho-CoA kinase